MELTNVSAIIKGIGINGRVDFKQTNEGVLVIADVTGLPESNLSGFFAFHIHEGETCLGEDFSETKSHYNPTKVAHPRHSGDLPPLLSNNGRAYMTVLTNRFTVREIIDKTVVIHSGPDDFITQPAGNAGTKIACGVIKK